jgi:23S rRNA pseudouridine2605 synthase
MKVSLNRALSKLGILSRAQATETIRAGRVRVNGRVVTAPARLVVPERVRIAIDDEQRTQAAWRTLLFHKPRGVVTTRHDPERRRTVFDVIGEAGEGLHAIGRLDLATSGLLLLTTDTQLANWITDPANAVPRVYAVTVRGEIVPDTLARLGPEVALRKKSRRESHLVVTLREGRNRQVRRMFEEEGHEVTRLKRVAVGGLTLLGVEPGHWRDLTRAEIVGAFPEVRLKPHAPYPSARGPRRSLGPAGS